MTKSTDIYDCVTELSKKKWRKLSFEIITRIVYRHSPAHFDTFIRAGIADHEKRLEARASNSERAAEAKARKKFSKERDERNAKEHGVSVEEYRAGRSAFVMKRLADDLNTFANERALELLRSWKVNGVPLGECSASELRTEAAHFDKAAATARRRAQWYRSLADAVGDRNTVAAAIARPAVKALILKLESTVANEEPAKPVAVKPSQGGGRTRPRALPGEALKAHPRGAGRRKGPRRPLGQPERRGGTVARREG